MSPMRCIRAIGPLALMLSAGTVLGGGTNVVYFNFTGTATGAGDVTVQLKESAGGDEIASRTYNSPAPPPPQTAGLVRNGVVGRFSGANAVPGYTAGFVKEKNEGGVLSQPMQIKATRLGTPFVANESEDIPGIEMVEKATAALAEGMVPGMPAVEQGYIGPLQLLGHQTQWMSEQIFGLDLGEGITVQNFQVVSDNIIVAQIAVAPNGPTGPEIVNVIGMIISEGQPMNGIITASDVPLVVAPAGAIPTVSEWGLIAMTGLFIAGAWVVMRRTIGPSAA